MYNQLLIITEQTRWGWCSQDFLHNNEWLTECYFNMMWSDWIDQRREWGGFISLAALIWDVRRCLSLHVCRGVMDISLCAGCAGATLHLTFWPLCCWPFDPAVLNVLCVLDSRSEALLVLMDHFAVGRCFFILFGNDRAVLFPIKFASLFYVCSVFHDRNV